MQIPYNYTFYHIFKIKQLITSKVQYFSNYY